MAETTRLSGCSDWINVGVVERKRTPSKLMRLETQLHLAGLSLSNTVKELEKFGVQRSQKAIHDWGQKADFQPTSDTSPGQIAVDETVIRIDGQQYWLYAAVNPNSNKFLHVRLFPTATTALTERFLQELREKHDVEDAVFLVDHAQHLKTILQRVGADSRRFVMGIGMLSNVSFGI